MTSVPETVTMTRSGDEITLRGALTYATVPALEKRLRQEFRDHGLPRRIDLAGIERADSAGFALMLECLSLARSSELPLVLAHPPFELITLAGLSNALELMGWEDVRQDRTGRPLAELADPSAATP
jgi:phospholipid transport system transporter-binding protein